MKKIIYDELSPFSPERMKQPKDSIKAKWELLRDELRDSQFLSNDMISAKKSKFLSEFDRLFVAESGKTYLQKKLSIVFKEAHCVRGTILKTDEPEPTFDRFIPNADYINEDNRFSPKGVEWLYLALGFPQDADGASKAEKCAQKECRAQNGDTFALCQFNYNHSDAEVVDLTIGDDWTCEKQREIFRNLIKNGNFTMQGYVNELEKEVHKKSITVVYANLISSELFVPINEFDDKSIMYAPFHCIAYYFKSLGYEGIIYKSTVYPEGKNMVLFDKNLATPFGTIKKSILNG